MASKSVERFKQEHECDRQTTDSDATAKCLGTGGKFLPFSNDPRAA